MRFDIYGHFQVEVIRENSTWVIYRSGDGLKRRDYDVVIPAALAAADVLSFLDDIYHEFAEPGKQITLLD